MNNDNDLNSHGMTKLSGWLRHCQQSKLLLRQGNFEEISYFKMEAEDREFLNLFPSI